MEYKKWHEKVSKCVCGSSPEIYSEKTNYGGLIKYIIGCPACGKQNNSSFSIEDAIRNWDVRMKHEPLNLKPKECDCGRTPHLLDSFIMGYGNITGYAFQCTCGMFGDPAPTPIGAMHNWNKFHTIDVSTLPNASLKNQHELEKLANKIEEGMKFDDGKPMWHLLPLEPIKGVVDVMTFGAKKYAPDNWKLVEKDRYESAFFRHWYAFKMGEFIDKDSGLPHIYHALCNIVFYCWKVMKEQEKK